MFPHLPLELRIWLSYSANVMVAACLLGLSTAFRVPSLACQASGERHVFHGSEVSEQQGVRASVGFLAFHTKKTVVDPFGWPVPC